MKKEYLTNGYVVHKKIYIIITCLWFLFAMIAFVLRINEIWRMEQKALSLSALLVLFLITGYMVYMIKNSMIRLEVDDNGIKYESSTREGLFFQKISRVVPWKSIAAVSILDKQKGPLKIDTADSGIIYWNIVNPKENYELLNTINDERKQHSTI